MTLQFAGLSFVKVHGSAAERERILTTELVVDGSYDVYLTVSEISSCCGNTVTMYMQTFDTLLAEEAFFSEALSFHTIIIDEGHRCLTVHAHT